MLGRWVPGMMVTGSVTVTLNSPDVGTITWCMGICAESPMAAPSSVAEVVFAPQSTSKVVAVPGADGLGDTVILGVCEAMAGAALASIGQQPARRTRSTPREQNSASARHPPDGHARTLGYSGFPFAACGKLTAHWLGITNRRALRLRDYSLTTCSPRAASAAAGSSTAITA